jgi:putative FmdB family regulatory protein
MPLYEYRCATCEREFELLLRSSEQPRCPECGGVRLEKLLSIPAAHTAGGEASLPMAERPAPGGCGLPACGSGGCMM